MLTFAEAQALNVNLVLQQSCRLLEVLIPQLVYHIRCKESEIDRRLDEIDKLNFHSIYDKILEINAKLEIIQLFGVLFDLLSEYHHKKDLFGSVIVMKDMF